MTARPSPDYPETSPAQNRDLKNELFRHRGLLFRHRVPCLFHPVAPARRRLRLAVRHRAPYRIDRVPRRDDRLPLARILPRFIGKNRGRGLQRPARGIHLSAEYLRRNVHETDIVDRVSHLFRGILPVPVRRVELGFAASWVFPVRGDRFLRHRDHAFPEGDQKV